MKRLLLIPALAVSLGLAGCATPGGGTASTTPSIDVTGTITQIQSGVQTFCGYQVTGQTVANILGALGVPYVGVAADVIRQVCGALTRSGAHRRGGVNRPTLVVGGKRIAIDATRVR